MQNLAKTYVERSGSPTEDLVREIVKRLPKVIVAPSVSVSRPLAQPSNKAESSKRTRESGVRTMVVPGYEAC